MTYKMTAGDFQTLLENRLKEIEAVLGQKAGEYAQNGDRLFNFRQAARTNNTTMAEALWGMATKHLVSVQDLVYGRLEPTEETVDEKCLDTINYLILLMAVFEEERCNEKRLKGSGLEGDAPCPQCGAVMLSDYVPHTLEKGV